MPRVGQGGRRNNYALRGNWQNSNQDLSVVLIVPAFHCKILAEKVFDKKGCSITKVGGKLSVQLDGGKGAIIAEGILGKAPQPELYYLSVPTDPRAGLLCSTTETAHLAQSYHEGITPLRLAHWRLGHRNFKEVARINGLPLSESLFCEERGSHIFST